MASASRSLRPLSPGRFRSWPSPSHHLLAVLRHLHRDLSFIFIERGESFQPTRTPVPSYLHSESKHTSLVSLSHATTHQSPSIDIERFEAIESVTDCCTVRLYDSNVMDCHTAEAKPLFRLGLLGAVKNYPLS